MRAFWRRLRAPAPVPAALGPSVDHRNGDRPAEPVAAPAELRASAPPAQPADTGRPLPAPILVSLADPAAQHALEIAARVERTLATLSATVELLQDRLDDLDARVTAELAACAQAAASAASAEELEAVRAQSARVAAEVARLNIDLRADLTAVAERVRVGSTPTVAATVAARRQANASPPERVVDLRTTWTGPDPDAVRPEPQSWATARS